MLDEEQSRERRAHHGAERVESVQEAERALQLVPIGAGERPGEHRERAAHQGRRHEQDERRQAKPQCDTRPTAQMEPARPSDVQAVHEGERERRNPAERADGDLQPPVQGSRSEGAVRPASEQPRSEPQAAHVGGDDRRHRLQGGAERLVENPNPQQLVDQARRPGQEEQHDVSAGGARTHAVRALRARDPPLAAG